MTGWGCRKEPLKQPQREGGRQQFFMRIKGLNANWSEQDTSNWSLQLELEESRLMNEVTRFQNTRNDLDQTQSQLNDIDDRVLKIKTD